MTQDRAAEEEALAIGARLAAIYSDVYVRAMRDVPICNAALEVEAIGFRPYGALALGIVVTPCALSFTGTKSCAKSFDRYMPVTGAASVCW